MQQKISRGCLRLVIRALALSCLPLAFSLQTAYAQQQKVQKQEAVKLISSKNPRDVFDVAKDAYLAVVLEEGKIGKPMTKLGKDTRGNPMIQSHVHLDVVGLASPVKYSIFFVDCAQGKNCKRIIFSMHWDKDNGVTEQKIKAWKAPEQGVRAFLSKNRRIVLQKRLDLEKGMSEEDLREEFMWWRISAEAFTDEFIAKK